MSSNRLREIYDSPDWKAARRECVRRAGNRCEHTFKNVFGEEVRCTATTDLTVNHKDPYGPPFAQENLECLCRRHHGQKDGGRAGRERSVF